ncbi:hypothetical protein Tco_1250334 [Tanacetum coccineum]
MIEKIFVEIQGAFLVKIRDNAFNGTIGENGFEHINNFLEVVGPLKINGVSQDRFRLSIFPISLAGAASEWFKKDCIGSVTTWEDLYELNNTMAKDLKEPWLDNGVSYQLCDHISEPYRFKNGMSKWPTCSSDIDGFCNGGELPGMVRVRCMTYFQDHNWYDELVDGKLKDETLMHKAKLEESWGDITPGVIKLCAWLKSSFENFHELDYNILVKLNYGADNAGYTQNNQEHKKEHHYPSTCRVRIFEMIKYSFDVEDERFVY